MLLIGESINGSVPAVGRAILRRDSAFISRLAQEQKSGGANMLDVNAGVPEGDEVADLPWLARTIQEAVDLPLLLDSINAQAVEATLSSCPGRFLINSISGERHRLDSLLPVAARYHCPAVIICLDDRGIPDNPQGRLEIALQVAQEAAKAGLGQSDFYVDPVVQAVGASWQSARTALDALRLIRERLPQAHTIMGISNVSFAMPHRPLLNATFLAMALGLGLEAALVDVRDRQLMAAVRAARLLAGQDPQCRAYLRAYRDGLL